MYSHSEKHITVPRIQSIYFQEKGWLHGCSKVEAWRSKSEREARDLLADCQEWTGRDWRASLCVAQAIVQEGASLVDTVVPPSCLLHSSWLKNTHNICTDRQSCKMLDKYSQYFLSHQLDPLLLPDPQDPVDTIFNFLLSIILDLQREGWVFSLTPHWSLQSMNFNF